MRQVTSMFIRNLYETNERNRVIQIWQERKKWTGLRLRMLLMFQAQLLTNPSHSSDQRKVYSSLDWSHLCPVCAFPNSTPWMYLKQRLIFSQSRVHRPQKPSWDADIIIKIKGNAAFSACIDARAFEYVCANKTTANTVGGKYLKHLYWTMLRTAVGNSNSK